MSIHLDLVVVLRRVQQPGFPSMINPNYINYNIKIHVASVHWQRFIAAANHW